MNTVPTPKKLKACVDCTKAKTRCTPLESDADTCKRCHRLGKTCVFADAAARPQRRRTSRRQLLEAKVDSLFNLLHNPDPAAGESVQQQLSTNPTTASSQHEDRSPQPARHSRSSTHGTSSASVPTPKSQPTHGFIDLIDAGIVSVPVAERLLTDFTRLFVLHFPFVTIHSNEDLATLRRDRPLLLQSLLAASLTEDATLQKQAGGEVSRSIQTAMMSRSHYSIDLLQAIMVHAAWYQYFFHPATQQFSQMIYFCITLIHELGIDRNPHKKKDALVVYAEDSAPSPVQESEAYRSLLGTYRLASSFAQAFRKPRLVQYTKYMDKCSSLLSTAVESQADRWIRSLIDIENTCLQAIETFSLFDPENAEIRGDLALQSVVGNFSQRIDMIGANLPSEYGGMIRLMSELQLLHASIRIREPCIHEELWTSTPHSPVILSGVRTTMAWKTLKQARKYLELFDSLKPYEFFQLTSAEWTQLLYVLIMVNRIVFLNSDDLGQQRGPPNNNTWDPALALKESDIVYFGQRLYGKAVEAANIISDQEGGKNLMVTVSGLVRSLTRGRGPRTLPLRPLRDEPSNHAVDDEDPSAPIGNARQTLTGSEQFPQPFPATNTMDFSATDFPELTDEEWARGLQSDPAWNSMFQDLTMMPLPVFNPQSGGM